MLAEYLLKTQFVVADGDESRVSDILAERDIPFVIAADPAHAYDLMDYIGYSIYAVDVLRVADILSTTGIRLAAVNDDINDEFDRVERRPVLSYGQAEQPNFGSLYYRLSNKVSIQDGDILDVCIHLPINDRDLTECLWSSIS
jgi:hypothetical protein